MPHLTAASKHLFRHAAPFGLNRAFMVLLVQAGMDSAIFNPDERGSEQSGVRPSGKDATVWLQPRSGPARSDQAGSLTNILYPYRSADTEERRKTLCF
jgi:hypothetical protein